MFRLLYVQDQLFKGKVQPEKTVKIAHFLLLSYQILSFRISIPVSAMVWAAIFISFMIFSN